MNRSTTVFTKPAFVLLFLAFSWGCSSSQRVVAEKEVVPVAVNIYTEEDNDLETVNWEFYKNRLIRSLKQNQYVDLRLAEPEEDPRLVLDVEIKNFYISPNSSQNRRQIYTRTVTVGTDAKGKPITQKVSASVDYTESKIRSNASLVAKLSWRDHAGDIYSKRFSATYTATSTTVESISGDHRAVDASVYPGGTKLAPSADDFVWNLSQQEMIRRISEELRDNVRNRG